VHVKNSNIHLGHKSRGSGLSGGDKFNALIVASWDKL